MSIFVVKSSIIAPESDSGETFDRLASLLDRFHVRASLFHNGPICGIQGFEEVPGRAFMHVLRAGQMEVRYKCGQGMEQIQLTEPTLLLFPKPAYHEFVNPPVEGSDFTCATLDFDGGLGNPIVNSLPSFMAIPLSQLGGVQPALDLLFAETDQPRCGSRLLVNRMFEVVLIQVLRWIIDHPAQAGVSRGMMMGLSDPRLAKALNALHDAPEQEWPLERMARTAGMSRSAFSATFKNATGTTPANYLMDWRISLASAMMRAGRSVKQAAYEAGFPDTASFSKVFRRRMGTSPREWLGAESSAS